MSAHATVVAFVCNWEGYRGLETAAQTGMTIPTSVKIVRVSCLSRLHTGLILKAFEKGAGGVILVGCADHHCHYGTDSSLVDVYMAKTKVIMSLLGIRSEQLRLVRVSLADGAGLAAKLNEFSVTISNLQ